jgi:hypothetical protein
MTWRYTCPEGHTTIQLRGTGANATPYYECESCRKAGNDWKYTHKIDQKTGNRIHV